MRGRRTPEGDIDELFGRVVDLERVPATVRSGGGGFSYPALVQSYVGSLRGYWRLGDAATGPWLDSSGAALTNSPHNMNLLAGAGSAPTRLATGALPPDVDDGALQFNNAHVGSGTGPHPRNTTFTDVWNLATGSHTPFTVTAWVKPTASLTTFDGDIFSNWSTTGGWEFFARWPTTAGAMTLYFRRADIGVFDNILIVPLSSGVWQFVVGTYDGATLKAYVDGALAGSLASAGSLPINSYSNGEIGSNGNIGDFYGGIDEVAFFAGALTAAEILALYNTVINPNNDAADQTVFTADGDGGTLWDYPTIEVTY